MRHQFKEYYRPSDSDIDVAWQQGLFVVDTNVLLDIYRYSKQTREKFFKILEKVGTQLWIPYWVGYEFHKDRIKVIEDQWKVYETITQSIENLKNNLQQHPQHPTLNIAKVVGSLSKLKGSIISQKKRNAAWYESDEILEKITEIFDGKVGEPYDDKSIADIIKEGDERYKKRIPPGYMDSKKAKFDPSGLRIYGDLIIWYQILDKAKETKKPIIFVTEDGKEDWWNSEFHGKKGGPRTELIAEMYTKAGVIFLMYDTEKFMQEAGERFSSPVTSTTIDELKQLKSLTLQQDEFVSGDIVIPAGAPISGTVVAGTPGLSTPVTGSDLVTSDLTGDNKNTGGTA